MSSAVAGTGTNVALTPGQNLYYRTMSTGVFPASATQTLTVPARPAAPTSPVEDDNSNTFDWTNNSSFNSVADYEFSTDSAKTWATATAKPVNVGNVDLSVGAVQVRVKASASNSNFSSLALVSTAKYTLSTGISVASFGKVILYPNPVSDNLIIQVDGAIAGIADIFDFSGKKLATVKLTSNVTVIDMSEYNAGSYLVRIITAKGISFKSIIKR
jgi:hypothetical protein